MRLGKSKCMGLLALLAAMGRAAPVNNEIVIKYTVGEETTSTFEICEVTVQNSKKEEIAVISPALSVAPAPGISADAALDADPTTCVSPQFSDSLPGSSVSWFAKFVTEDVEWDFGFVSITGANPQSLDGGVVSINGKIVGTISLNTENKAEFAYLDTPSPTVTPTLKPTFAPTTPQPTFLVTEVSVFGTYSIAGLVSGVVLLIAVMIGIIICGRPGTGEYPDSTSDDFQEKLEEGKPSFRVQNPSMRSDFAPPTYDSDMEESVSGDKEAYPAPGQNEKNTGDLEKIKQSKLKSNYAKQAKRKAKINAKKQEKAEIRQQRLAKLEAKKAEANATPAKEHDPVQHKNLAKPTKRGFLLHARLDDL